MILEYYCLPHCKHKPVRANPSDAGLDLCFNPKDGQPLHLESGESYVLPTGLKFGIPHGYMLEIKNRSGNAAKKQWLVGACVVDSGYDGEVFVNIHNTSATYWTVHPGDKVAQGVLIQKIIFMTGILLLLVTVETEPWVVQTRRRPLHLIAHHRGHDNYERLY